MKTGRPRKDPEAIRRFADILNRILAERNITQQELAEALGTSQQVVSTWCLGRNMPVRQMLIRLAAYLGVTVEYLKGGE